MQAFTRLTQRSPHDRGDRHLRIGHVGPGRGWRHVIVNEVGRALVIFDRSSACQDAVVEELVSRMRCQASGARRDVKAPGVGGREGAENVQSSTHAAHAHRKTERQQSHPGKRRSVHHPDMTAEACFLALSQALAGNHDNRPRDNHDHGPQESQQDATRLQKHRTNAGSHTANIRCVVGRVGSRE